MHPRGAGLPSEPPAILQRLFLDNARVTDAVRHSATTRALVVLHALYYMTKLSGCALCFNPQSDMIDLSRENKRAFGGAEAFTISKLTIEWAGGIRCALAWLEDAPEGNYW